MPNFNHGDVVVVDLGMAAKMRPCVVVSIGQPDRQRNMSVVVPMTTGIRSGECEIHFPSPAWLRQESVVTCWASPAWTTRKSSGGLPSFLPIKWRRSNRY